MKSATNFSVIANTYGNMNNVASTAVKAKDVTYNNTGSNLTSVDV